MSLLSTYVTGHLLHALEQEFIAHEPDLQAKLLEEVKVFTDQLSHWVNSKVNPSATQTA